MHGPCVHRFHPPKSFNYFYLLLLLLSYCAVLLFERKGLGDRYKWGTGETDGSPTRLPSCPYCTKWRGWLPQVTGNAANQGPRAPWGRRARETRSCAAASAHPEGLFRHRSPQKKIGFVQPTRVPKCVELA